MTENDDFYEEMHEVVELTLSTDDLATISLKAHYADMKLNDYIVYVLKRYVETFKVNG